MRLFRTRHLTLAVSVILAGCSVSVPSGSVTPSARVVHCANMPEDRCADVAEAAELMLGTESLTVEPLPLPSDGGLAMAERYLVRLTPDEAGDELVEVVRFVGKETWSTRRLSARPSG